jgi:HD-GYP domain-containing protein (c-di-GMP phosphodiesterase class II)
MLITNSRADLKQMIRSIMFEFFDFNQLMSKNLYIVPLIVGLSLNILSGGGPFESVAPFLIPYIVQGVTRGKNRYYNWAKDERLRQVIKFNNDIVNCNQETKDPSYILENLAGQLLQLSFGGVFIIKGTIEDGYKGHCFKYNNEGKLVKSSEISLQIDENVPVFASRKQQGFVWENGSDYTDLEEFNHKFKFHEKVIDFLETPVSNWIDFHSKNVSIIAFNKSTSISRDDELILGPLVSSAQSLINIAESNKMQEALFFASISGLCAASEYSDEITGQHVWRVNKYSRYLAEKMDLPSDIVNAIGRVAALHDIGKVAIPELIKYSGKYNDEERLKMQLHTVYGADILSKMQKELSIELPALTIAIDIALHHHQYWNGTGYPGIKRSDGIVIDSNFCQECHEYNKLIPLKGDEIPIHALIVGLADTYDALRNARQYKPAFSHEKTVSIMALDDRTGISGADRFSPKLWDIFVEHQSMLDSIYQEMK